MTTPIDLRFFDESKLLQESLETDEIRTLEKEVYDNRNLPSNVKIIDAPSLQSSNLFFICHDITTIAKIVPQVVLKFYMKVPDQAEINTIVRDFATIFFLKKNLANEKNVKRQDAFKNLSMREAIRQILPLFAEEKKLAHHLIELGRLQRIIHQANLNFQFPLYYTEANHELTHNRVSLPPANTIERFFLRVWFKDCVPTIPLSSDDKAVSLNKFFPYKDLLEVFKQRIEDPELARAATDILNRLVRNQSTEEFNTLFEKVKTIIGKRFVEDNKDLFSGCCNLFPFILFATNHLSERDKDIDTAIACQADWSNSTQGRFCYRDRASWKYSSLARRLVEDACRKNYFTQRQNQILLSLKEIYGKECEALFAPYLPQLQKTAVPLNLEDFQEEEKGEKKISKGKKPLVQKKRVTYEQGESSGSRDIQEPVPTPLTTTQEKLKSLLTHRFCYSPRVCRFFNIDPSTNLEKIRAFKNRGELVYQKASNIELLNSWKLHCFPPIELIAYNSDFKKKFTVDNNPSENRGFWLLCGFQFDQEKTLYGRVQIGFHLKNDNEIVHRFFTPTMENTEHFKYISQTLMGKKNSGEEDVDPFYGPQSDSQYFFKDQLFEVEGEGELERISIRDNVRKMSITAIQIPSWMK